METIIQVIAGPTASGKSALAIQKAFTCNGVIINADALQVYNALPLLTAQPSAEDKEAAPHRLYGVIPASEICSATRWADLAIDIIRETLAAGQTPILVGGTGLYLRALMEGFSPVPAIPPEVRNQITLHQQELGNPAFHQAFSQLDPVMAARLHPHDTQRLIRAWEVLEATGQSLSIWQQQKPVRPMPEWSYEMLILDPPRPVLYERCDRRFLAMMDQGALEEVRDFDNLIQAERALPKGGAAQALGFHPLQAFLHGKLSKEEAIRQAQADTRHYAKRQVTWWRHQIAPADHITAIHRQK